MIARWERCSPNCLVRPERLIQQELQLAKTELSEKASKMGEGAALIVGGGLIAYGWLARHHRCCGPLIVIALGLPPWAAAGLGGSLVAGLGYMLIRSGWPLSERKN